MATVKPIPDGYHSVQAYLIFQGCTDAIAFSERALSAKEKFRMPDKQGRTNGGLPRTSRISR